MIPSFALFQCFFCSLLYLILKYEFYVFTMILFSGRWPSYNYVVSLKFFTRLIMISVWFSSSSIITFAFWKSCVMLSLKVISKLYSGNFSMHFYPMWKSLGWNVLDEGQFRRDKLTSTKKLASFRHANEELCEIGAYMFEFLGAPIVDSREDYQKEMLGQVD